MKISDTQIAVSLLNKGIEDDDLQGRPGHLGIVGMRERAAAIGADLLVERGASGGTVVELTREVAAP